MAMTLRGSGSRPKTAREKRDWTAVRMVLCLMVMAVLVLRLVYDIQKPRELREVPREELLGAYVSAEVPVIYQCFAYTTDGGDAPAAMATQKWYITDANRQDFCGLCLEGQGWMEAGDTLLRKSELRDFEAADTADRIWVSGTMRKIPDNCLWYYHEAVGYYEMSPEGQEIFLPYYLDAEENTVPPGEYRSGREALFCLGGVFVLGLLVLLWMPGFVRAIRDARVETEFLRAEMRARLEEDWEDENAGDENLEDEDLEDGDLEDNLGG